MGYEERLNIKIIDTVLDPNKYGIEPAAKIFDEGKPEVLFSVSGDTYLYKVWIFLAGEDLPRVKSVNYQLHETFDPRDRAVQRTMTNQDCQLVIWTWGVFQINATIMDQAGRTYVMSHQLTYDKILTEHQERLNYLEERPESSSGATLVA